VGSSVSNRSIGSAWSSCREGGGDTSTWREFDTTARRFVPAGFALPEAKSNLDWFDENTLVVGTDWGTDSLTTSGYART
jgi:prolyl oligopeptidase